MPIPPHLGSSCQPGDDDHSRANTLLSAMKDDASGTPLVPVTWREVVFGVVGSLTGGGAGFSCSLHNFKLAIMQPQCCPRDHPLIVSQHPAHPRCNSHTKLSCTATTPQRGVTKALEGLGQGVLGIRVNLGAPWPPQRSSRPTVKPPSHFFRLSHLNLT
jgi:hypothetical protein